MTDVQVQKSFASQDNGSSGRKAGILYLVGTPIGNLDDMTYRAVAVLKEVSWVAAEDTRQTRKLLNRFEISARLLSYHEHNKEKSGSSIISKLQDGESVALVSDAGLPAISDPGVDLVEEAVRMNIPVVPIPGPNAALSALIASGLPTERFTFLGFLPREKKKASAVLEEWKTHQATIVLYEAPHRLLPTMRLLLDSWGDRRVVMARELTKRFEEFTRGTVASCLLHLEGTPPIGEYCLIVEGAQASASDEAAPEWWTGLTPEQHVARYEKEHGLSRKDAIKQAASDRNVPKRIIYNEVNKKTSFEANSTKQDRD
ncbi:16S rRNA (cytidine(1402)-2'-O)-methyltransferase [Paenibacillus alkalitolerans]|uniref:16S rRNA (cytidine(1402)-2'-O)-methyltransferase n=1 Tax=Paenibacillus alkalitolerans TaxID=2799335 RepID=UPI0018F5D519|nr:16S rRNA (cytidine(1402)-2'-O)-methyltransferase [Paenibacillus alkalitolerans]